MLYARELSLPIASPTTLGGIKVGDGLEIDSGGSLNSLAYSKAEVYQKDEVETRLSGKVDKVTGKGLSTNDYTAYDMAKVGRLTVEGSNFSIKADNTGAVIFRQGTTQLGAFGKDSNNNFYIQVGDGRIVWDSANNALIIVKSDGTSANLYSTGGITALS